MVLLLFWLSALPLSAAQGTSVPLTLVVLGDSLSAGYGLPKEDAFPAQLEQALIAKGYQVRVVNAGISGDTSAGGAARLEWSIADEPDLVIIQLGANDALRGLSPAETRANLVAIITGLQQRQIAVLLAGMLAPRNMGRDYYNSFDKIYPDLEREFAIPLYPFFLEGVAGKPELNLADGIHPNVDGVRQMVAGILPLVVAEVERLQQQIR